MAKQWLACFDLSNIDIEGRLSHVRQGETLQLAHIVFNGFSAFNKGSSFSYYENEDRVLGLRFRGSSFS